MSRLSTNEYSVTWPHAPRLLNGYDYENQAWVRDGRYGRCGHPQQMNCGCYGRIHEGEETK